MAEQRDEWLGREMDGWAERWVAGQRDGWLGGEIGGGAERWVAR